jgi:hypothetical protein
VQFMNKKTIEKEYTSLTSMLRNWFDTPLEELPTDMRAKVIELFTDHMGNGQRRWAPQFGGSDRCRK